MFDSKNSQNLGTSNFIHGMLAARNASQCSFPIIAALDFFRGETILKLCLGHISFPLRLMVLLMCFGPNMLPDLLFLITFS